MMFLFVFLVLCTAVYFYRVYPAWVLSYKCRIDSAEGVTIVTVPTCTIGAGTFAMGFSQSMRIRVYSFFGTIAWVFNPRSRTEVDRLKLLCMSAYLAAKRARGAKQVVIAMPSKYEWDTRAGFAPVNGWRVYSSKEFGAAVLAHELVHGRRMLERGGYWTTAREHFEEELDAYAAGWEVLGIELPQHYLMTQAYASCALAWPAHELSAIRKEVEALIPEEDDFSEDDSEYSDEEYSEEESSEDDSDDEEWEM